MNVKYISRLCIYSTTK